MIKNVQLLLRTTQEEKKLLKKIAHKYEMNVSEFVRYCIQQEINSNREGDKYYE